MLLLFFLALWLQSAYREAFNNLQQETNLLFLGSIREVEDNMLDEFLIKPLLAASTDTTRVVGERSVTIRAEVDTLHSVKVIKNHHKNFTPRSDDFTIELLPDKLEQLDKDAFSGSLSLFIAMGEEEGLSSDSAFWITRDTVVGELLEKAFEVAMNDAAIPLTYQLTQRDTISQVTETLNNRYFDVVSGKHYVVAYDQFRPYLLKQITPQILFSVLLFASICLAFYLVYQNWQQQKRLTELKNDFISNITHELKTPITTVGVAIEALSNFNALDDPSRTREYLEISKHELGRLSILVDKVLKMSLFERTEPELKLEPLDLHALIQEILLSMKLQFDKQSAEVQLAVGGKDFNLQGDKIHLTSVIYNLLDNALKYSKQHPKIKIGLQAQNGMIQMEVQDKGIGIAPEYMDKIFDKFFRVPHGNEHNTKGYGLGLSYVASVVHKHKGDIQVDSHPGAGTKFTVTLPQQHD